MLMFAACAILLTGCDPVVRSNVPASIQQQNGEFRVALCETVVVKMISVSSRGAPFASKWVTFWDASGRYPVKGGTIFQSGTVLAGLNPAVWKQPQLGPGDTISLLIIDERPDNSGGIFTNFVVPSSGMPSGMWLHADGSTSSSPCV